VMADVEEADALSRRQYLPTDRGQRRTAIRDTGQVNDWNSINVDALGFRVLHVILPSPRA